MRDHERFPTREAAMAPVGTTAGPDAAAVEIADTAEDGVVDPMHPGDDG